MAVVRVSPRLSCAECVFGKARCAPVLAARGSADPDRPTQRPTDRRHIGRQNGRRRRPRSSQRDLRWLCRVAVLTLRGSCRPRKALARLRSHCAREEGGKQLGHLCFLVRTQRFGSRWLERDVIGRRESLEWMRFSDVRWMEFRHLWPLAPAKVLGGSVNAGVRRRRRAPSAPSPRRPYERSLSRSVPNNGSARLEADFTPTVNGYALASYERDQPRALRTSVDVRRRATLRRCILPPSSELRQKGSDHGTGSAGRSLRPR